MGKSVNLILISVCSIVIIVLLLPIMAWGRPGSVEGFYYAESYPEFWFKTNDFYYYKLEANHIFYLELDGTVDDETLIPVDYRNKSHTGTISAEHYKAFVSMMFSEELGQKITNPFTLYAIKINEWL